MESSFVTPTCYFLCKSADRKWTRRMSCAPKP